MPKSYQKREKERLRRQQAEAARAVARASAGPSGKRKRRRLTDGLIGLSSAAILAVYGAGYLHTQRSDVRASEPVTAQMADQTSVPAAGQAPLVLRVTATPGPGAYRDGTYVAWGQSRHGDIEATVTVQGGKIVSAGISDCQTRYSCSYMKPLVGEVLSSQKAPVDHVSGATDSSHAYTEAIKGALAQAV